jgi:thiolase-like protein
MRDRRAAGRDTAIRLPDHCDEPFESREPTLCEDWATYGVNGATGVAQLIELVRQLRGEAHSQVEGAEVGLAHNVDGDRRCARTQGDLSWLAIGAPAQVNADAVGPPRAAPLGRPSCNQANIGLERSAVGDLYAVGRFLRVLLT